MGFVLSKFRKEKSTTAILEGLQVQIQDLEKYAINTQERKRRFVTNFVGFTIGVYVVGFALWYFFYFPPTMQERIMYLVPLLLFPVLIVLLRQMFTWYFQRKLNKNGDKLAQLKEKKNKILEQVMDKETYKVAVNLLERFGDKQQNRLLPSLATRTPLNRSTTSSLTRTPQAAAPQPQLQQQRMLTPYTGVYRNMNNNNLNSTLVATNLQVTSATPTVRAGQELRRRTPFPVIDESSRSALDRIVDFIVGDGPQNRVGMICKQCHRHNGMLPMEEYEYTTFHCAFCDTLNQARKERPVAPRLSLQAAAQPDTPLSTFQQRNDSSDTDSSDDEDDESDDKLLTRRALHPEYSKTESDAQTEAMDVDETETKSEPAVPAADAAAAAAGTATPSKTEAKE